MKTAFGLLELVIVLLVIIILYFTCGNSNIANLNIFSKKSEIRQQKVIIDDKIKDIEKTKALREQIERDLQKGNP